MSGYTFDFNRFWQAYPKRHAPGDRIRPSNPKFPAFKAWLKALTITDPETIINSVEGYKSALGNDDGTHLVCQCTTYLNQRRWESYIEEPGEPAPAATIPEDPRRKVLYREFGQTDYSLWFEAVEMHGHALNFKSKFRTDWVEQQFGDRLKEIGFTIQKEGASA